MFINFFKNSKIRRIAFFFTLLSSIVSNSRRSFAFPPFMIPQVTYSDYLRESFHIIKEYYVDKDLIDNEDLLNEVVKKLQEKDLAITLEKKIKKLKLKIQRNVLEIETPLSDVNLLRTFEFLAYSYMNHDKNSTESEAFHFLVKTMMDYLDPHSVLLSTKNYKELLEGTEGVFGGLGIIVSLEEDHILTIGEVLPNSPAEKTDLKPGDKIIGIESEITYPYSLENLVSKMKGPPGSSVLLQILSKGAKKSHTVKITRDIILVDSVDRKILKKEGKNFLYLNIKNFSSRTASEITNHIRELQKKKVKIEGLLLDLRENPGGLLGQAVYVSDIFLDKGPIVHTKGINEETKSAVSGNDLCEDCPIAVLIGSDSASASEIVASALQDGNRATIIGSTSFGKSTVQALFELPSPKASEKEALKLTIARYYRASGNSLQNVGVVPDLMVQNIYENPKNENLFGDYRYGREKFLGASKVKNPAVKKSPSPSFSPYNLYHLIKEEELKEDFLLELGLETLVHGSSSWKIKEKKSSSLLDRKKLYEENKKVKEKILAENKKTSLYLKEKHKITWSTDYNYKNSSSLNLSVSFAPSSKKKIESGSLVPLKYKIENKSKKSIERVSLFIRDPLFGVATQEKLIGQIPAGKTLSGVLTLTAPQVKKDTNYEFQVGLAVDGLSSLESITEKSIDIKRVLENKINTKISLGGEQGGKTEGSLEALEKAKLFVEIENESDYPTREITLKAINLSGDQVVLDEGEKKVSPLKAHEKRTVEIPLSGSKEILEKELRFGLSLSSYSSYGERREVVYIKGETSKNLPLPKKRAENLSSP